MDFILSISQGNHGTRWETLGRIGTGRSRLTDENFGTVWDTSTFFGTDPISFRRKADALVGRGSKLSLANQRQGQTPIVSTRLERPVMLFITVLLLLLLLLLLLFTGLYRVCT